MRFASNYIFEKKKTFYFKYVNKSGCFPKDQRNKTGIVLFIIILSQDRKMITINVLTMFQINNAYRFLICYHILRSSIVMHNQLFPFVKYSE